MLPAIAQLRARRLIAGLLIAINALVSPLFASDALQIKLQRLDDNLWQADYQLPAAAKAVEFARGAGLAREKHWQLLDNAQIFEPYDQGLRIRRRDGQAFSAISVRFSASENFIPRDYTFLLQNTDGGALLYTGHLYLAAVEPESADSEPDAAMPSASPPTYLTISSHRDESIVVSGAKYRRAATFKDEQNEGSYVYFGDSQLIETPSMFAIIDKGAPLWLKNGISQLMPRLFTLYEQGFGFRPSVKPMVLLSYKTDEHVSSFSGGVIGAQIQLSLTGKSYETESASARRELIQFVAHEAAHFWQRAILPGQSTASHSQAWVHEGGADAIAYLALLEMGEIDTARYHATNQLALNQCIRNVNGIALPAAFEQRRNLAYYQCGAAVHYLVEQEATTRGKQYSAFDLWRDISAAYRKQATADNTELLFAALTQRQVKAAFIDAVRKFTSQTQSDSRTGMQSVLDTIGLKWQADASQAPASAHIEQAKTLFASLMAHDCQQALSFTTFDVAIESEGLAKCSVLKEDLRIVGLAGQPLTSPKLDSALRSDCHARGTVAVMTEPVRAGLQLKCPAELPAAPIWLTITTVKLSGD